MNRITAIIVISSALTAHAAIPLRWVVDVRSAAPATFEAYQGETIELTALLHAGGKPLAAPAQYSLYWQTNGMGSTYWSAPCMPLADGTNAMVAVWRPNYDVGARVYNCFIGAPSNIYHAAFQLRLRPSPGARPNELPLPTPTIDCSIVTFLHPEDAPFSGGGGGGITAQDATNIAESAAGEVAVAATNYTDAAIAALPLPPVESVNGMTGTVELTAWDVGAFERTQGVYFGDSYIRVGSPYVGFSGIEASRIYTRGQFVGESMIVSYDDVDRVWTTYLPDGISVGEDLTIFFPEATGDVTFALASDIPTSFPWGSVTGKPTTLSGYGIEGVVTNSFRIKPSEDDDPVDMSFGWSTIGEQEELDFTRLGFRFTTEGWDSRGLTLNPLDSYTAIEFDRAYDDGEYQRTFYGSIGLDDGGLTARYYDRYDGVDRRIYTGYLAFRHDIDDVLADADDSEHPWAKLLTTGVIASDRAVGETYEFELDPGVWRGCVDGYAGAYVTDMADVYDGFSRGCEAALYLTAESDGTLAPIMVAEDYAFASFDADWASYSAGKEYIFTFTKVRQATGEHEGVILVNKRELKR